MNRLNLRKARKIARIESEDPLNPMHTHRRHQPRIMHLNSANPVVNEYLPPLFVYGGAVGKKPERNFKFCRAFIRFLWRQPVSVAIDRPRHRIPELTQILRCITEVCVRLQEMVESRLHNQGIGVLVLNPTDQNIAIQQIPFSGHLPPVLIEAGAIGSFRWQDRQLFRSLLEPLRQSVQLLAREAS